MSKRTKAFLFSLILAVLVPAMSFAATGSIPANPLAGRMEGFSNVGNRAAEFLTIPVGARGIAMGGAFIAQADDISAIYWNPAGLGFIEGPQAFFSHLDMPLDFSLDYAAAALPLMDGQLIIGGFFGILNIGEEEITTVERPDGTGAFYDGYSAQFGGTIAYNFMDRFSAGLSVKAVREAVFQMNSDAVAFDMGTNYHTELFERPVRVSFVITNLGTNMQYSGDQLFIKVKPQELYSDRLQEGAANRMFPRDFRQANYKTSPFNLPTSFMAGMSMDMYEGEYTRWTVAGQFAENNYMPASYAFGTELTHALHEKFTGALRWGWNIERDEVDLSGSEKMRGMGFGGGIEAKLFMDTRISIDYAYRDMGRLTQNHVFTLMWKMY